MKSVGEAMAIGRTFGQAFVKAMRSRELDKPPCLDAVAARGAARAPARRPAPDRYEAILELLAPRRDDRAAPRARPRSTPGSCASCRRSRATPTAPFAGERSFTSVDTCAAEFPARTPYYYSGWERPARERHEVAPRRARVVVILGSGPNRIGQGIEFDYCCVHAAMTVRESGRDAVMINCNPETVSTDYDTSDRLYFEPLTLEDVLAVVEVEQPEGRDRAVRRPDAAEARRRPRARRACRCSARASTRSTSPRIAAASARCSSASATRRRRTRPRARSTEALAKTDEVGFPLLVRPSYVLGGRAMEIVYSREDLADYLRRDDAAAAAGRRARSSSTASSRTRSRSTSTRSATGTTVWIGGIMQHVEEAGVHSGDSACVLPPHSLGEEMLEQIRERHARDRARDRRRRPAQRAVRRRTPGELFVIEANPRASRTVPFVSKAVGVPLAKLACRIMLGERIADARPARAEREGLGYGEHVSVKEAVLPFDRFDGADALLGPEMRSTGEVMGIARDFPTAFAKAQAAAGVPLPREGTAFITVTDSDKAGAFADRRRSCTTTAFGSSPRAAPPRRSRGWACPSSALQQDRRGLAARARLDRARRRRPRRQHADRLGRAHRRLGDPPRGGRATGSPA